MNPRGRFRTTKDQVVKLLSYFEQNPLPSKLTRETIAAELGMTPRSVQIWFQNRRAKLKNQRRERTVDLSRVDFSVFTPTINVDEGVVLPDLVQSDPLDPNLLNTSIEEIIKNSPLLGASLLEE